MARVHWAALFALMLAGCLQPGGGRSDDDGGPPSGGDLGVATDADTPDVPPAQPGGPRILSLDSDTARLTVGEALRITAVVTDEDGPEDVLGGLLEDPMGGSYGAFVATGPGTYQVDVDWAALQGGQTECAVVVDAADGVSVAWAHFVTGADGTTASVHYDGLAPALPAPRRRPSDSVSREGRRMEGAEGQADRREEARVRAAPRTLAKALEWVTLSAPVRARGQLAMIRAA